MSENRFIKRMESKPETRALLELYVGIIIFSTIFLVVGIIFIKPRLWFGLGVILGGLGAVLQAYGIYDTLDRALSEDKENAQKQVMLKSIARLLISFIIMVLSILISKAMFVGVIFGLLSLKLSGVFNPIIKKLILKHKDLIVNTKGDEVQFQLSERTDEEDMSEPEYHKHDLL